MGETEEFRKQQTNEEIFPPEEKFDPEILRTLKRDFDTAFGNLDRYLTKFESPQVQ